MRRKTRQISVGWVKVGGDAPIVVQSMTSTKTHQVEETLFSDKQARQGRL
jgi:(E)-4-hydroxy-3-methylbut-2-enyl-diphosphate synthase